MDCCGNLVPTAMPFDFVVLFTTGLMISLGHCIGMCGPLVTTYAVHQQTDSVLSASMRQVVYHFGRVSAYTLLGVFAGFAGSTAVYASGGKSMQAILSLAVGVMMLLLGLGLLKLLPYPKLLESGPFQRFISDKVGKLLQAQSYPKRLLLGFANGFLPCGPVYTVALTAAGTGSWHQGGLSMLAFGAGTIPVLVALGFGLGKFSQSKRAVFQNVGAILILIMATQLILRGLAALQYIPHLRFGEVVIW
ncbi:sulfite exporter TauE/SafE family protein [bacterium]|nr:sulfite exporter TauE/SafE family protein [bacterium]MBT4291949.1 sulfite exporter TauE/SafE family protein [bacterium]MBT7310429.1 sulfite exporter TauE/SafE family protein [bacterium]